MLEKSNIDTVMNWAIAKTVTILSLSLAEPDEVYLLIAVLAMALSVDTPVMARPLVIWTLF